LAAIKAARTSGAAPVELSLAKFTGEGDMGKNFQKNNEKQST
jgi:hypothetical protein